MLISRYEVHRGPQKLAELWTLSRGVRDIRCALFTHPAGWELKLIAVDSAFRTRLCETSQQIHDTADRWRAEASTKGWT